MLTILHRLVLRPVLNFIPAINNNLELSLHHECGNDRQCLKLQLYLQADVLRLKYQSEEKLTALLEHTPTDLIIQTPVILPVPVGKVINYMNYLSEIY